MIQEMHFLDGIENIDFAHAVFFKKNSNLDENIASFRSHQFELEKQPHSYRLSPLGPALQFGGGSKVISPNSFWILLAEVLSDFDIFGVPFSLFPLSGESLFVLELLPASLDIYCRSESSNKS